MKYFSFILSLFIIKILSFIDSTKEKIQKISTINVLLPICESINCNKVYYTVHAQGGCFEWSVDKPDLLNLEQIQSKEAGDGCFHKVQISPVSRMIRPREVALLIARDKKSNEQFKCIVGFGKINKLVISKRFDYLNVGDSVNIYVNAYDEKDNLFSSLKGFRFHWKISNGNTVEVLKLSQEKVKVGQKRLQVEIKHHSDIILLKGVNTGKVSLIAELLEEDYSGIISAERNLYVIEPFKIYPSEPLYILPNNTFQFNIDLNIHSNVPRFLPPSHQKYFSWSIGNQTCGKVKNFGDYESKEKICTTSIVAKDTRIDAFNIDSSIIHVVQPTALNMAIVEILQEEAAQIFSKSNDIEKIKVFKDFEINYSSYFDNSNTWKLVEKRVYLIKNILMHERHPIRYSQHAIKFVLDSSYLNNYVERIECFHEKEVCLIKTKKPSEEYLTLESKVEPGYGVNKVYSTRKNIKIFPQVHIEKFNLKSFTLPFLGFVDSIGSIDISDFKTNHTSFGNEFYRSQELRLIVKGGTGNYLFNSENSNIVYVREEILYGKNQGTTRIKVTDSEIPSNFDFIEIEVREVKDFMYLEERQEVEIGSEFYVNPLALKSVSDIDETSLSFYYNNVFTNCTDIRLNTSLSLRDKNLPQIPIKTSNFQHVSDFLQENRNLIDQKLKLLGLDKNLDNIDTRYLSYINFGVCQSKGFIAENEGLIRLSFTSNIFGKRKGAPNKIFSSYTAKIYVYSPMSLFSPKFEDIFTKELITKTNIADPYKIKNFVLAVGSGILVKYSGGIIPWSDYQDKYNEEIYLYESRTNQTYSTEMIKDKIKVQSLGHKELYFQCFIERDDTEIVLSASNNMDKTLLRPGRSSLSISIACSQPKYLSIFFLGVTLHSKQMYHSSSALIKDEYLMEVFSLPQKAGIEYYERKHNIELARVYAFDDNKRIFYNITSMGGNWDWKHSIPNKKLFSVMSDADYKKYLEEYSGLPKNLVIYDGHSKNPEYIDFSLLFADEIGKFDLFYTMKNKLSHYVTINLIDFPVLNPSNSTLYLSANNILEIAIENGSGDFEIKISDNELASFTYIERNRKIVVSPNTQGILQVYVKDKKINNNFMAIATVYISKIKKIQLFGGGFMMVNNTMSIKMKVYDYFDNEFPHNEIMKMNLIIGDLPGLEIIYQNIHNVLIDQFSVKGLKSGTYNLFIFDKHSPNMTSNQLNIEVFDKLEVFPPSLLLVPGSSYTLSIRGGPVNEQHIIKKYQMVNSTVASVLDAEPQVSAHLKGQTVLKIIIELHPNYNKFYRNKDTELDKFVVVNNRTNNLVLAVEEVNVTVDFPDSVSILGAINRKIYTRSTIRLSAALKLREDTFTYGIGPFNFDWSLDNTLIAKLKFYKSGREECSIEDKPECLTKNKTPIVSYRNINPYNSLGVFLTSYQSGNIKIKLTVTINYPDPYSWRRKNIFTREEKISINDEIYVDIPEFYENIPNKSGLYLIPLDIDHQVRTNKNTDVDVSYSIISQHGRETTSKERILELSESGKITTFHKSGTAHIMINRKTKDNSAFIPVILPVFVSEYYALFGEKSYQLIDMENGEEKTLKIILQHQYGLLFADGKFERFKLKAVESHPGVAKAELLESNSKIKIKANKKGETNIILFDPVTLHILDVFQVSVFSSLILPEQINLNLGGKINFLKKDDKRKLYLGQDSEWISDDETIVRIDPLEGLATGIKEGSTKVHLVSKDRSKIKLTSKILVTKVRKTSIERSNIPKYLTNIKTSEYYNTEYHIPIHFFVDDSASEELSSDTKDPINEIDHKLDFKCVSNQPEIFIAEADQKSTNSDIRECILKIRDVSFDIEVPSNLEFKVIIDSKQDRYHDSYSYKTTFKLPFSSQFRIKNNIRELTFTPFNRTQFIYLDTLKDIEIKVEDESLFKIETLTDPENYVKLYVPSHVNTNYEKIKLILKNKLTKQSEEILLNYVHSQLPEPEKMFYGLIRRDTLVDLFTLVILVVTILILYNYISGSKAEEQRRFVAGPNVSASRPPQGSGVTSAFNMNR